jgi:hypothetical protein
MISLISIFLISITKTTQVQSPAGIVSACVTGTAFLCALFLQVSSISGSDTSDSESDLSDIDDADDPTDGQPSSSSRRAARGQKGGSVVAQGPQLVFRTQGAWSLWRAMQDEANIALSTARLLSWLLS